MIMSEKLTFVKFFRKPALLSSFGGLYVPGAHKLLPISNVFDILFKFLTASSLFFILVTMIDVPMTVIQKKKNPDVLGHFLLVATYMILCNFLRVSYMIIRRKEWSNIIHQWDISFQQPLFRARRLEELNKERKFVERIVQWEYGIMVIPVIIWAILPPLIAKKQSVESVLPWDHTKSPTFELTASYHFFYGVFMTTTWSANDSWMIIYMSMITAQLQHLKYSLTSIFNNLKATAAGKITIGDLEITDFPKEKSEQGIYYKEMNKIRQLLKSWIDHHSELISFSQRLKHFYSPIILLQYIFFVGFNCMMLFYTASGLLAPTFVLVTIPIVIAQGYALYLMCWFGDRIARQNELLSQEAFYQDWLIYPKDITNSLKLIILESRRPIALSAFSIMPLNIKTFEQILKACYSFFMFIRDSNRKSFKEIDNKII